MDEQEMRKDFERIFMLTNYDQGLGESCLVRVWKDQANSPYSFNRTEYLWALWKFAWQASRKSLVVELPELFVMQDRRSFSRSYALAHNRAIESCANVIKAAGVKVKE